MFTEIGIENFKAFGKMQRIPLKPITLLYGPNSSGKSSLMQSLLLFKQTLEESGNEEVVLLPKGNLVDLGSVSEFINKHDWKKDLTFSFSFKHLWHDGLIYNFDLPKLDQLTMEFSFFLEKAYENTTQVFIKSIRIFYDLEQKPLFEYKNIWFLPKLRQLIMRKANAARKKNEDNTLIEKWISDVKRSILVLESINLESELIKDQWHLYAGIDNLWSKDDYLALIKSLKKKIDSDKEKINLEKKNIGSEGYNFSEIQALIKSGNYRLANILIERLGFNYSTLADSEYKEIKRTFDSRIRIGGMSKLLSNAERRKIKQTIRFLRRLVKSFRTENYELFSTIKDVPCNKLVFLSNCFPRKLSTDNNWIFQYISDFESLSKSYIDKLNFGNIILDDYIVNVSELVCKYLNRINYIGPLRDFPERSYSFSGNILSNVGKTGGNMPDMLFRRPEIVESINKWFSLFDIDYKLRIIPIANDLFTISLRDKKTKCTISPKDVGFGISQLLPILVQGIISQHNIICIEQPEIHIHPRLQAELGSFIAACADRWQDIDPERAKDEWPPPEPGNQFIIETHSEHLILRLLRLIRDTTNGELKEGEKPLRPEDVAVIYARPTEHGAELMELRISEDGDFIDKWPDGFFTERAKELF